LSRYGRKVLQNRPSLTEVTKNIIIATFISALLGFAMIGGAVYWQLESANKLGSTNKLESANSSDGGSTGGDINPETPNRSYTVEELAQYDGKGDNQCLVAVDGDVYLIEGFALWSMGEHIPSGGRARCGLDLTEVIDESPHGRSKLQLLKKVGTLE
jgi:predicted heme/steroid binding protein